MDEIDFGIAYRHPTKGTVIKVTMNEFRDQIYIHLREYGVDPDTGWVFPTKSGYAIRAEELDSVIELLQKASAMLGDHFRDKQQIGLEFEENNE